MIKIKEIEVMANGGNLKHYRNKGYIVNYGQYIIIKIKDLPPSSNIKIECFCDICDSVNNIVYRCYNKSVLENGFYRCGECSKKIRVDKMKNKTKEEFNEMDIKRKNTSVKKYGVDNYAKTNESKEKCKKTCLYKYGANHYVETKEFKEKSKNTCLDKYGVTSYRKTEECQKKIIKTCLDKYGVDNYTKTDEYKEKTIKTNLEKYGVEYSSASNSSKKKVKNTCLKKYGTDSYMKTDEFKKKSKNAFIEKYGVDSPMKNREILEKQQKSAHKIIKHDILDISYQGTYELDFINYCILHNIKIEKGPTVDYVLDGNDRKYHSDFYIPKFNLICEIKSTWTYNDDYKENLAKKEYSIKSGYNFLFIIDKNYEDLNKIIN